MALGVLIGICLDNIAVWMSLGLAIGISIDLGIKEWKDKKNNKHNNDTDKNKE